MIPRTHARDRNHIAERMARLIVLLIRDHERLQVTDIAAHLGVCTRTVLRYLQALELAGFAVPRRWRCVR